MAAEPTTWVFDVDGCLVDSLTGSSLRPLALDLLSGLGALGLAVLLWSAGGADYARRRAAEQGIEGFFHSFHGKDERGLDGRYMADHLGADLATVVFVDDRPEDVPTGAEVIPVSPYLAPDVHDRGLVKAAARAGVTLDSVP